MVEQERGEIDCKRYHQSQKKEELEIAKFFVHYLTFEIVLTKRKTSLRKKDRLKTFESD